MQVIVSLFTTYLPYFVLVLTLLVFVHEFGHYWVGRRFGIHAEVFSIGFGPELIGWTDRNGTRWKISAIPLGGYVKMAGEATEDDTGTDAPHNRHRPAGLQVRKLTARARSARQRCIRASKRSTSPRAEPQCATWLPR